jgi:hypothetical protein
MVKLDLSAYAAILAEHYPCTKCGSPGVLFHSEGFNSCADHFDEVDVMARADHQKWVDSLFNAKKLTTREMP